MSDPTPPSGGDGLGGGTPPPPSGGYQPPSYQPGDAGQYGQPGYGQPGYGGPTPTNGLAIAALILGILALLSFFTIFGGILLGLLAIVLGAMGVSKAKQLNGSGRGLAIAGIVTGVIAGLLSLLLVGGIFAIGNAVRDGGITIDGTEFEFPTE